MCSQLIQQCMKLLANESRKYVSHNFWSVSGSLGQKSWMYKFIHMNAQSYNKKSPNSHNENLKASKDDKQASETLESKVKGKRYKRHSKANSTRTEELWKILSETHEGSNDATKTNDLSDQSEVKTGAAEKKRLLNDVADSESDSSKSRKYPRIRVKKKSTAEEKILWDAIGGSEYSSAKSRKTRLKKNVETANEVKKNFTGEVDAPLQITTKKVATKPSPTAKRDENMFQLLQLQEVVEELDVDEEDGKVVKDNLAKRFQIIQEQKAATEVNDFKSLLKEIRNSSLDGESGRFQWETAGSGGDLTSLKLNLSSVERLGIFNKEDFSEEKEVMNPEQATWSAVDWYKHYASELSQKISFNPGEYYAWDPYDELVRWTNEGKLWKFPVNNEEGMDEEAKVPFYEHVFLEDKLNEGDWCPKTGPIRNFMTSVCVALSRNAYLTVTEKHEHIEWFRDYFNERIDTIKTLGLIDQ